MFLVLAVMSFPTAVNFLHTIIQCQQQALYQGKSTWVSTVCLQKSYASFYFKI